ncbi:MAG: hypothetical protein P8011_15985, partial [Acidihalobacter sp.]
AGSRHDSTITVRNSEFVHNGACIKACAHGIYVGHIKLLKNVEKLQRLAEQSGSSAAEIVRKAIDAYEPQDQDETESPELMELVSARLKDAIKATRRANRQVAQTLKALDTGSE